MYHVLSLAWPRELIQPPPPPSLTLRLTLSLTHGTISLLTVTPTPALTHVCSPISTKHLTAALPVALTLTSIALAISVAAPRLVAPTPFLTLLGCSSAPTGTPSPNSNPNLNPKEGLGATAHAAMVTALNDLAGLRIEQA